MNQNNNNLNNIFKAGMFSSTPQKTTSPFGSTAKPSVFGNQQPFSNSNIFQSTTANSPLQNSQSQPATPFGQSSNLNSIFQNQPKPTGSVFGALGSSGTVQPLTNQASGAFGGTNQASGAFGSQPTTTSWGSTSPFSSTAPSFTSTAPSFTPSFSSFQPTGSLSIGSLKNGTRDTAYQDTRVKDGIGTVEIKHINAMNEYTRKSNDELRSEDYNLGRKAITSGPSSSALGGFGGATGQQTFPNTTPTSQAFPSTTPTSQTFSNTTPTSQTFQPFTNTPTTNTFSLGNQFSQPSFQPSSTPSFGTGTSFGTPQSTTTPLTTGQSPFGSQTQTTQQTPSFTTPAPQPSTSPFGFPSTNTQSLSTPFQQPQSSFNQQTQPFGAPPSTANYSSLPFSNTSFMNSSQVPNTTLQAPPAFNGSTLNHTTYQPQSTTTTPVNYDDPFLVSEIKFEKTPKRSVTLTKAVPKPIFSQADKKPLINLTFRPPRTSQRKKIYTEPSAEEAKHLKEIENLIIGFEGKGRIQYLDKVCASELSISNIEDKISFLKSEVIVSDPPGVGLNKRARVYVEGVFAFSKSQGDFIVGKADKFPLKGIQERFVYGLKEDVYKKFIDYNYETGLYVYEVNHF